jgi:hypothetical protein
MDGDVNAPGAPLYDDAELVALQVVREAISEETAAAGYSYTEAVTQHLLAMQERQGDATAVAVTAALGRLVTTAWSAVLHDRLGHYRSPEEMLAEVDSFEMHKMEQHQFEQDEGE